MAKYTSLCRFLQRKADEGLTRVEVPFGELDDVVPGRLPNSARDHRAWWANTGSQHVQAEDGWLAAGWRVESADLHAERVVFKIERRGPQIIQGLPPKRDLSTKEAWTGAADDSMMNHLQVALRKHDVPPSPKPFPLVSEDHRVVGDKTYSKMLEGGRIPYAVHATISETVWLLQQTRADRKFIVFGNDRQVPITWVARFGPLADGVEFYFLEADDEPELIKPSAWVKLVDGSNGSGGR